MPFRVACGAALADRGRILGRDPVDLDSVDIRRAPRPGAGAGWRCRKRDSRDRRGSATRRSALGKAASASVSRTSASSSSGLRSSKRGERGHRRGRILLGVAKTSAAGLVGGPARASDSGRSGRRCAPRTALDRRRAAPPPARSIWPSRRATKRSRRVRKATSKRRRNSDHVGPRAASPSSRRASARPRLADLAPDRLAHPLVAAAVAAAAERGRSVSATSSATLASLRWP